MVGQLTLRQLRVFAMKPLERKDIGWWPTTKYGLMKIGPVVARAIKNLLANRRWDAPEE